MLSREQALERFGGDSPGLVPGIGPKTVAKLEAMGIATLAELGARPRAELEGAFGPRSGAWLHFRGRLWDETPITVERETKSVSVETTYDTDLNQRGEIEAKVRGLAEELCKRLRQKQLAGRTIGLKVRLDDWTNVTRSHTVEAATNDPAVVVPAALELLRAYDPQRPVRLLGVRVAGFDGEAEAEPAAASGGQLQLGLAS